MRLIVIIVFLLSFFFSESVGRDVICLKKIDNAVLEIEITMGQDAIKYYLKLS